MQAQRLTVTTAAGRVDRQRVDQGIRTWGGGGMALVRVVLGWHFKGVRGGWLGVVLGWRFKGRND